MEKITGSISKIEITQGEKKDGTRWKRASFEINGKHYSTFNEKLINSFNSGDLVELEFEPALEGKFKNIASMKRLDNMDLTPKIESNSRSSSRLSIRETALKVSASFIETIYKLEPESMKKTIADKKVVDLLLNLAKSIEDWIDRKEDFECAVKQTPEVQQGNIEDY